MLLTQSQLDAYLLLIPALKQPTKAKYQRQVNRHIAALLDGGRRYPLRIRAG